MNNIPSKTLSTQRWITLLVVMLTSMGLTGPATALVMVSNFNEAMTDQVAPTSGLYKQTFRTGFIDNGYILESIQIDFGGTSHNTPEVTVLNADGSHLTRLHRTWDGMNQRGIEGSNDIFTRWPEIPLKANTEYTITVKGDSNFGNIHIRRARTNGEDTERRVGWSINDESTSSDSSWRIKVNGRYKPADPIAPFQTRGLSATAISSQQIELSWNPHRINVALTHSRWKETMTGHRIEVSNDGVTGWTDVVANTGDPKREYTHKGIPPSTTRHYRVSAINRIGTGRASTSASATTLPWNNSPSEPRELWARIVENTIGLLWVEPLDLGGNPITYYGIEISTDDGTNWNEFVPLVRQSGGGAIRFTAGDTHRTPILVGGTTYHFRVYAYNQYGRRQPHGYSNSAQAEMPAQTQTQVTNDPLTAELRNLSVSTHDGSAFTFELHFNENVLDLSSQTLRDSAFTVTNGRIGSVRQLAQGEQPSLGAHRATRWHEGSTDRVADHDQLPNRRRDLQR